MKQVIVLFILLPLISNTQRKEADLRPTTSVYASINVNPYIPKYNFREFELGEQKREHSLT